MTRLGIWLANCLLTLASVLTAIGQASGTEDLRSQVRALHYKIWHGPCGNEDCQL